jgi:hypothetical protein
LDEQEMSEVCPFVWLQKMVAGLLMTALLVCQVNAGRTFVLLGSIDEDEWSLVDRMHPKPWEDTSYLPDFEIYGAYDGHNSTYYFALKTDGTEIGLQTAFYFNVDQSGPPGIDQSEYFVNFVNVPEGTVTPYLYDSDGNFIGPVEYTFSADNTTIELAVASSAVGNVTNDLNVLVRVSNGTTSLFFPQFFDLPPLELKARDLPPRTSEESSKRVAIVFSEESANNYFGGTGAYPYSQLYASMQHQAMMAGVPYDLLYVDELKTITNLVNYDAIVFPYNANVKQEDRDLLASNLRDAVYHYKIGIITSGDWFTNKEDGMAFDPGAYQVMQEVLGVTIKGFRGPENFTVTAETTSHPVLSCYEDNEELFEYKDSFYNFYTKGPVSSANVTVLGSTDIMSDSTILASTTNGGARHVHFGTPAFMGDANLVWKAIRWSAGSGGNYLVGLQLGRQNSVFSSRCDMDQSRFIDDFEAVEVKLLNEFIIPWKEIFDFVGTYFICLGNNTVDGEFTDWNQSRPLYQKYIDQGNEIGSHSNTHPDNINLLTNDALLFEFNDTQNVIKEELNFDRIATAQPGNPENFDVVAFFERFLLIFYGTWTGIGSGYPGAFGFLKPDFRMAYFAPNMKSDFSLVQFERKTAEEATEEWAKAYDAILAHAATPIAVWHWHDYGPTNRDDAGYTVTMFEDTIQKAYIGGAEFVTTLDLYDRIQSFTASQLQVIENGDVISVTVTPAVNAQLGRLAIDTGCGNNVIQKVDGWFAYNNNKLFLPRSGGVFPITMGQSADNEITRITALPMRSDLLSVTGDSVMLTFSFIGTGTVTVELNEGMASVLDAKTSSEVEVKRIGDTTLEMSFRHDEVHQVEIKEKETKKRTKSKSSKTRTSSKTSTSSKTKMEKRRGI